MEVIKFIEQNAEFQRAFGYKVNTTPVRVTETEKKLRYKLFEEEFIEYQDAFFAIYYCFCWCCYYSNHFF